MKTDLTTTNFKLGGLKVNDRDWKRVEIRIRFEIRVEKVEGGIALKYAQVARIKKMKTDLTTTNLKLVGLRIREG
jgi:hypothetical protein